MSAVLGRLMGKRARADAIVEGYQAGSTLRQVGNLFSLSAERVRQILRDMGIETRPRGGDWRKKTLST